MTLLIYRVVALAAVLASLTGIVWWHGYSTGTARWRAAQEVARAEAARQAKVVDNLRAEIDILRARRPVIRERLVEVARRVEVPAACVTDELRELWNSDPAAGPARRSDAALPDVAGTGRGPAGGDRGGETGVP